MEKWVVSANISSNIDPPTSILILALILRQGCKTYKTCFTSWSQLSQLKNLKTIETALIVQDNSRQLTTTAVQDSKRLTKPSTSINLWRVKGLCKPRMERVESAWIQSSPANRPDISGMGTSNDDMQRLRMKDHERSWKSHCPFFE